MSLARFTRLNDNDIRIISLFIDNIRRTKDRFTNEQQTLIQIIDANLTKLVKGYQEVNKPNAATTISFTPFSDRRLNETINSLLALGMKDGELQDRIRIILKILKRIA